MRWIGHEIIRASLAELANEVEQRKLWTASGGAEVSSFAEAVERLFTDSGLGDALDRSEAVYDGQTDALLRDLETLLSKIDLHRRPLDILRDPATDTVRASAAAILARLA